MEGSQIKTPEQEIIENAIQRALITIDVEVDSLVMGHCPWKERMLSTLPHFRFGLDTDFSTYISQTLFHFGAVIP